MGISIRIIQRGEVPNVVSFKIIEKKKFSWPPAGPGVGQCVRLQELSLKILVMLLLWL